MIAWIATILKWEYDEAKAGYLADLFKNLLDDKLQKANANAFKTSSYTKFF
jgi:hypothetical protein